MPIYELMRIYKLRIKLAPPKPYPLAPNGGFTLLETLVAVTILVTGILTPLNLASQAIRYASFSQHQIIASYLAQEGIELVRNTRDNNFLQGINWSNGNNLNNCGNANGCYIYVDPTNPSINSITQCGGGCPPIKYDSTNQYYTYKTGIGINTPFTRKITVLNAGGSTGSDEVTVRVTVSWLERFAQESFTVQENIFNWRK